MLQFKLNKQTYQMPTADELTYQQYIELQGKKTDLERLEYLLGAELKNIPDSCEREMNAVLNILDGLRSEISQTIKTPEQTTVTVLGNELKFDKDLGKLAYWPMTKVKAIIQSMGEEPFNAHEHYGSMVAHYLYSKIAEYDEYKAEEFAIEVVNQMHYADVIRLGDFFLYMQRRFWSPKLKLKGRNPIVQRLMPA